MPIYEFRCKCCDDEFETLVWHSEIEESVACPKCRGTDVERVLSVCSRGSSQTTGSGSSCQPRSTGFS
jgi:putative FmdB family regulatory protein